jgi:hypothetical protein
MVEAQPASPEGSMGLFQLLRFYWEAGKYTSPGPTSLPEQEARWHRLWHRRIVAFGVGFGILGLLLGTGILLELARNPGCGDPANQPLGKVLVVPLLTGIVGPCFGVATACLFAPRSFLEGPLGRKWLRLIGTRKVLAARLVCFLVDLVLAGAVI